MKYISAIVLSLIFCLALAACGGDTPTAGQGQDPLVLQNTENGRVVTLGLSRQAAEAVLSDDPSALTPPADWNGQRNYHLFPEHRRSTDHLLRQRSGGLVHRRPERRQHYLPLAVNDGLSRGAEETAVIEQYGQALSQNQQTDVNGILHLSYYYDEEGQLLGEENGSAAYVVLLELDQGKLIGYQVASTTVHPVGDSFSLATTLNQYDRVAHTGRSVKNLSSGGYVALSYKGITN